MLLDAVERHRRQERPVRQLGESFALAAHTDEGLNVVVPRRQVCVAEGPIDGDPFPRLRFEGGVCIESLGGIGLDAFELGCRERSLRLGVASLGE